jgi:tRNA(fMet)-specific endonuclease VapC
MAADPRYLIDTNIAIYLLEGTSLATAERLADCELGSAVTSSICLAEIMIGLTEQQSARLPQFLANIAVVPFDEAAARAYAALPFRRRSFDRLIAGHALSLGLALITANVDDFADVPGLRVEDWTAA